MKIIWFEEYVFWIVNGLLTRLQIIIVFLVMMMMILIYMVWELVEAIKQIYMNDKQVSVFR